MYFMPLGSTSERDEAHTMRPEIQDYTEFYTLYAECMACWSGVESSLLSLYMLLLQVDDYHAASAAFYSTNGFRIKLDLVDAIVKNSSKVEECDRELWNKLYKESSKKSRRRNQLAHNTVYYGRFNDNETRRMFIADPRNPSEGARLYIHDLRNIRDAFEELRNNLFSFWSSLIPKVKTESQ
ncbi:hypothetical protein CGI80_00535 [Vibrio parahaemolyticus]|uniref:hypothetical protein n=1 Tax=Vibrionaceae TaxID=641 RepID=UPI00112313B0|nr:MULTISPECIES: hypothetical protein [Vibrionaceae]QSV13261.1 hypothetical protein FH974_10965 [Photobacterium ganghwense]TOH54207.1 hypothetical protein CGI80_00535 [Vibrio parahaemolyticus]